MVNRIEIVSKANENKVSVYTIDKNITKNSLIKIAKALTNPVSQNCFFDKPYCPKKFSYAIEIGYLPGVTDNIANTTKEIIEDLLKIKFTKRENIYTSQIIFITKKLSLEKVKKIAEGMYNPIIQKVKIKSFEEFQKNKEIDREIPIVNLNESVEVDKVDLNVDDQELIEIGKKGIIDNNGNRRGPLALDLTYLKAIQSYFKKLGRNPTDIELESIAQTWSEHCKHTIFSNPIDDIKNGLFETYIKAATKKIGKKNFCYSVFKDNSGAIEFDKNYLITDKVETHNSPSALDPFGGAITGIVGVNRDTIGFGLGAKPIMNRYGFCFADPKDNIPLYRDPDCNQKMLEPRRIMDGVIKGVNVGGNCSGIPTPQGFMFFDHRYKGKPLVFVGTVGLIPKKIGKKRTYVKKAQIGDYIVMVGGRVGKDGIHGATFSSEILNSGSPVTAVQIGDPITQKKFSDAIVNEARDMNLYSSMTDNGAGGLSCSVAEMAKETNGCLVKLDLVPLKYPGLSPWQIWISESQERMTLAIPKRKWKAFHKLMEKRGVEATIIGEFNNSGHCVVTLNNKKIMDIEMEFLHNGLPPRPMKTTYKSKKYREPNFKEPKELSVVLNQMLSRLNLAGFEFLSSQYDHEVQGGSVLKPLQGEGKINGEATITKPILDSNKGVVISQGIYPTYGDIDTYHMAACSIDTAIKNAVVVGTDINRIALLDNFCWCSPDNPQKLGELKKAAKACFDYAMIYKTPFISGKDSMFNDFKGYDKNGQEIKISIPPTLLISTIGVINDVTKTVSIDLKFSGDLIYVLGETFDELGASEYFQMMGETGNKVPKVRAIKNIRLYQSYLKCLKSELIVSAIGINRGGLGVALAKMAMAGKLGVEVTLKNLSKLSIRNDYLLFSETQGRILISVNPKNEKKFLKLMKGNTISYIGTVSSGTIFKVQDIKGKTIINTDVNNLLVSYKKTFKYF